MSQTRNALQRLAEVVDWPGTVQAQEYNLSSTLHMY